jgi:sugar phosphate isomerase/epimerase
MKYSMMTYTVARQPKYFDLRKMLALTAEIMDGIDFVTLHDTKAKELKKMTDDLGIPVVCHTFFATDLTSDKLRKQELGLDACKRGVEAAVELGAPVVMIPTGGLPGVSQEQAREQWINGLKKAAPVASAAGTTLTIENFPGHDSPFVTASDLLEAIKEIPDLRLTYDNGNAASGEDPVESFRQCSEYVAHSHFKDWDIVEEKQKEFRLMRDGKYYRPALIGEGKINHRDCLKVMQNANYNGYINIEYEGDKYQPYDAIRKAVEYLQNLEAS